MESKEDVSSGRLCRSTHNNKTVPAIVECGSSGTWEVHVTQVCV